MESILTEQVKAYTAGLLERSAMNLYPHKNKKHQRPSFDGRVFVTVHSQALSEWLTHFWGGSARMVKDGLLTSHVNSFFGQNAGRIVHETLPYLIYKRDEALILESYFTVVRKVRYIESENRLSHKHMPEEYRALVNILIETLRKVKGERGFLRTKRTMEGIKHKREAREALANVYHDNIFDLFDGVFTVDAASKTKSIFDDLLK